MRVFGRFLLRYLQKLEIALAICKNRSLWAFVSNNVAGAGTTNKVELLAVVNPVVLLDVPYKKE